MQYFKDFFNKFCLKISSSKFFKFFFGCVFLLMFIPNVKASEMIFGANGSIRIYNGSTTYVTVSQSANNLPKTIYGLTGNGSLNLGVIDLSLSPASGNIDALNNSYNYLIFDTCLTGNVTINITNNGCTNSCVATGSYSSIKLSTSCTTGGNSGYRYLIQVPIQKWYLNEVAEMLEATSFITISNNVSWSVPIKINQVFLSDEDYTVIYSNQSELIDKLNSVQTAITNMQNSINSNSNTNTQNIINNQNTNTQNIINNQNTNAAQAHTDSQNIKNSVDSIKNQDHTYNNNASESLNGGSDLNNLDSKQSQLRNNMDLDTSSLDIQFDSSGATFIWDIISSIRSVNSKITILFTTLLSLGIIKFIFNR